MNVVIKNEPLTIEDAIALQEMLKKASVPVLNACVVLGTMLSLQRIIDGLDVVKTVERQEIG